MGSSRTVMTARRLFCGVLIGVILVTVCVTTAGRAYAADESAAISDEQAEQIRQNCKPAQSLLQRLQTTDVATRINRGRIYENLLNRLITPFNNRVNVNRYDASTLALATSGITQKFADFKTDYSAYENSFTNLLGYDCASDPRGFYDLLVVTRENRAKVAADVSALNTLITGYTDAFTALRRTIEGQQ